MLSRSLINLLSTFDKWTHVPLDTFEVDTDSLDSTQWVGHRDGAPAFAFNNRNTGFVLQSGNSRVVMSYPADTARRAVFAVNSTGTQLVGGGAAAAILVYDCTSGRLLQALSDPLMKEPLDPKAEITAIAASFSIAHSCQYASILSDYSQITTFRGRSVVATCTPRNRDRDLSLIIWAQAQSRSFLSFVVTRLC